MVTCYTSACSVGWFKSLLVREEILLAGLCERKILFRLKIYDRLRQATAKRTCCLPFTLDFHLMQLLQSSLVFRTPALTDSSSSTHRQQHTNKHTIKQKETTKNSTPHKRKQRIKRELATTVTSSQETPKTKLPL